MIRIKYLTIMLLLFITSNNKVNAACNEDIEQLKIEAKNIEVTYNLNEEYYVNETKVNGTFTIEMKNLPDTMFAKILGTNNFFRYEEDNSIILDGIEDGTKKITIYSKICGIELRTITLKIPKYNKYSEREECIDKNTDELEVCDKWYPYELNESIFQQKLKEYNEKLQQVQEEQIKEEKNKIINSIIDFLTKYYLYIISGIIIVVLIVIIITVKKKKYSLE